MQRKYKEAAIIRAVEENRNEWLECFELKQ